MRSTDSFHAHHSPIGAHASFTIGMFGANGGLALEKEAQEINRFLSVIAQNQAVPVYFLFRTIGQRCRALQPRR